jgi:hypothetical protein
MEGFMEKVLGFLVLSAALTGCAVIDKHEPVPGWPALKVVEHYVATEEMLERCQQFARFSVPEGCTHFHFDRSEAHIFVRKDFPAGWVLKHERLHAAGYDHVGSTAMHRMLEAWKAGAAR